MFTLCLTHACLRWLSQHCPNGLCAWPCRVTDKGVALLQVYQLMEVGAAARMTGATKLNERSSRSHAVFILIVEQSRAPGAPGGADDEMDQFRGLTPGAPPAPSACATCLSFKLSEGARWHALRDAALFAAKRLSISHMLQQSGQCASRCSSCWAGQAGDGQGVCVAMLTQSTGAGTHCHSQTCRHGPQGGRCGGGRARAAVGERGQAQPGGPGRLRARAHHRRHRSGPRAVVSPARIHSACPSI